MCPDYQVTFRSISTAMKVTVLSTDCVKLGMKSGPTPQNQLYLILQGASHTFLWTNQVDVPSVVAAF